MTRRSIKQNGDCPEGIIHPGVLGWFRGSVGVPSTFQKRAWKTICAGGHILISSPTGSGKTLAAIMPAVSSLADNERDAIGVKLLYISPMRAMGMDLMEGMGRMSRGIGSIIKRAEGPQGSRKRRKQTGSITIGIRTGDVPQSERRRLVRDPPDILITTPENLILMLCSSAGETLRTVRTVVIDEVHELLPSKRGALLSLGLELLEEMVKEEYPPPQRIGLSATIGSPSTAAGFIGGVDHDGRRRDVEMVLDPGSGFHLKIRSLMDPFANGEAVLDRVREDISERLAVESGSTVIFHNTRKGAEETAYILKNRSGIEISAHHGSLGPDLRRDAEEGLRSGELRAVVSSSSLELGMDIGHLDEVIQVGSPKDPSKLLQRLGRSGHRIDSIPRGLIYPLSGTEMVESAAVALAAARGSLDERRPHENAMDVLAQFAVGLSLRREGFTARELYRLCKRAYPFRRIRLREIENLLSALSERSGGRSPVPVRLWRDAGTSRYRPRRGAGQSFYLNCGTIPREINYSVRDGATRIGDLSREYAETLYEGDVIMLASKAYRVIGFSGRSIRVKHESDAVPTVPSWRGEVWSRPSRVGDSIYEIYGRGTVPPLTGGDFSLTFEHGVKGSNSVEELIGGQLALDVLPGKEKIPVETIKTRSGRFVHVFHIPLGAMVNEPTGRVISYGLRRSIGAMVEYIADDDGFALLSPVRLSDQRVKEAICGLDIERTVSDLATSSAIFRSRFTNCMMRSLLVLARYRGKETGHLYRRRRVDDLRRSYLHLREKRKIGADKLDGPERGLLLLGDEALKEVLHDGMDLKRARLVLEGIESAGSLEFIPDEGELSPVGKAIASPWLERLAGGGAKNTAEPPEGKGVTFTSDMLPISIGKAPLKDRLASVLLGSEDGAFDVSSLATRNELDEGGWSMLLSEGSRVGELFYLDLGRGRRYVGRGEERLLKVDPHTAIAHRAAYLDRASRLSGLLRALPFFTHPVEISLRTTDGTFNNLRSLALSGALVPYKALGQTRFGHPRWARVFWSLGTALSDLMGAGSKSDMGGEGVSQGLQDIAEVLHRQPGIEVANVSKRFNPNVRDVLGCVNYTPDPSLWPLPSPVDALEEFLDRLGPFSVGELRSLFGQSGCVLEALACGLMEDRFRTLEGPSAPLESIPGGQAEERTLWIDVAQPKGRYAERVARADGMRVLFEEDALLRLCGLHEPRRKDDRARSSRAGSLICFAGSDIAGEMELMEGPDRVIITNIEVKDFRELYRTCLSFSRSLDSYGRLGYDVFLMERILGVPAGEGAVKASEPFRKAGFTEVRTRTGRLLLKGAHPIEPLDRSLLLREMLCREGLMGGCRKVHPLQVVFELGGIVDRWEVLGRLGKRRHPRVDAALVRDLEAVEEKVKGFVLLGGNTGGILLNWEDRTTGWREQLPEGKDLMRKYGLWKVMMDQPYPVWTLPGSIGTFPIPAPSELGDREGALEAVKGLKGKGDMVGTSLSATIGSEQHKKLQLEGFAIMSPWGDPGIRSEAGGGDSSSGLRVRGALQRGWVMRVCALLGLPALTEVHSHSPRICDVGKLRNILNELSGERLTRVIQTAPPYEVRYLYPDLDLKRAQNDVGPLPRDDMYTVISPRDRMSRVLSGLIGSDLPDKKGYLVFKGLEPLASVTLKRGRKGTRAGAGTDDRAVLDSGVFCVKGLSYDIRRRRKDVLREVRRAFFQHGIEVVTEGELERREHIYGEKLD